MKHIVFITINKKSKLNGINRIYIGIHNTNPETFDGYLGDGIYIDQVSSFMYPKTPLQYAVKKYGVKSFKRVTLFICDTQEEAYNKLLSIADKDFLNLSHVYNYSIFKDCPLYQFDFNGNLKKSWTFYEASSFYGLPIERFRYAVRNKYSLLNSFWNDSNSIDIHKYDTKPYQGNRITHLFNKDGKKIKEFISREDCAKYLHLSIKDINEAILKQTFINNQYYITNFITDLFKSKPRRQYSKSLLYVYNENSELIGKEYGKKIMPIIKEHSWKKIYNAIQNNNGWYKDFFLSTEPVEKVKPRKNEVDVYDSFGNYITGGTLKSIGEEYNIPKAKLKDIEKGIKNYNNYIFKYHSK